MTKPVRVHATLTPTGHGSTVVVEGHDVSDQVAGMRVYCHAGSVTEVELLSKAADVVIDGEALVRVDPGKDVAVQLTDVLRAIDPEELEAAALNRPDLTTGPGALTAAVLRQIEDYASGRT